MNRSKDASPFETNHEKLGEYQSKDHLDAHSDGCEGNSSFQGSEEVGIEDQSPEVLCASPGHHAGFGEDVPVKETDVENVEKGQKTDKSQNN